MSSKEICDSGSTLLPNIALPGANISSICNSPALFANSPRFPVVGPQIARVPTTPCNPSLVLPHTYCRHPAPPMLLSQPVIVDSLLNGSFDVWRNKTEQRRQYRQRVGVGDDKRGEAEDEEEGAKRYEVNNGNQGEQREERECEQWCGCGC